MEKESSKWATGATVASKEHGNGNTANVSNGMHVNWYGKRANEIVKS
jgi:hypothetical protein